MSIQLKSDGKNKQVRIEKDGVVISSIIPELHYGDYYEIRSWESEVDWDFKLKIYGSFLVVFASGWPINQEGWLCLLAYEEEPTSYDTTELWPRLNLLSKRYQYKTNHLEVNIEYKANGSIETHTHYLKMFRNTLVVYADQNIRWLFSHPNGTRAAYEHMQATTLSDDLAHIQTIFSEEDIRLATLLSKWSCVEFNDDEQDHMEMISRLFTSENKTDHMKGFEQLESLGSHWIFSLMEEHAGKLQWQVEPILFHFGWHLRQLRTVMSLQHIHINGEPKLKGHTREVLFEALFSHSNFKANFIEYIQGSDGEWKRLIEQGALDSLQT